MDKRFKCYVLGHHLKAEHPTVNIELSTLNCGTPTAGNFDKTNTSKPISSRQDAKAQRKPKI
jgi:hypothetical protein